MKNNQSGFGHLAVILIIVFVGAVGFGAWRVVSDANNTRNASLESSEQSEFVELPEDLSAVLGLTEIQSIASEATELQISNIELESEDGVLVYVVTYSDGTVKVLNANNGAAIREGRSDNSDDDSESLPQGLVFTVSIQQAIQIAKSQYPGVAIEKVEIEVEDGVVVYSVRFVDDGRVDVAAGDGAIERVKTGEGEEQKSRSSSDDDDDDHDDDEDRNRSTSSNDDDDDDDEDEDDDDDDKDDDDDDRSGSNSGSGSSN